MEVNLGLEWEGTPPEDLRGEGDSDFENSRDRATEKLAALQAEAGQKGRADHLTERLIESKTGRKVEYAKLTDLASLWRGMPRGRKVTEKHLAACDSKFQRFIDFMNTPPRKAGYLHEVSESDAGAYLECLQEELTDESVRQAINLLRSAFTRFLPVGMSNPFRRIVLRGSTDKETIHRIPFTSDELQKIFDVSASDTLLHPLIVCAACTGMRRGDVCRLRWVDVDLQAGIINCKTGKTRERLEIPIFGPLHAVLEKQPHDGPFVFSEAADLIETRTGQSRISWGFKYIVTQALTGIGPQKIEPLYPAHRAEADGMAAIEELTKPGSARRKRLETVLKEYLAGASYRVIHERHGYSRGQISGDLQAIENKLGGRIRRKESATPRLAVRKATNVQVEGRKNAASVRDWHALRVTFVTIALSAGVPMELVRRITGHKTVDIVLKHYFRPDREHFKSVMIQKMPGVLTGERAREDCGMDEIKRIAAEIADGRDLERNIAKISRLVSSNQYMRES
ncbi:MAG: tyrosine-type recombinase/integrase [Kiritimatiellae bacterium]|nr:tyrosine-type recombinase/integrase [Kiritimatiellia bacterium]